MKRSEFLKALAAVIVAPSILITAAETMEAPAAIVDPPVLMKAFWWKVSEDQVLDTGYMRWLLTDPASDFWKAAAKHGVDLTQPHTIQMGLMHDDFVRTLQTIVIRQPQKAAA